MRKMRLPHDFSYSISVLHCYLAYCSSNLYESAGKMKMISVACEELVKSNCFLQLFIDIDSSINKSLTQMFLSSDE